jgi:hypothetical protein
MKIVIWGYPLHTHTHSYIHNGFKKGFEHLDHEVHWFHDEDYPEDFDYDNCVFLTEGFADKNIPLRSTSTYFVHVCVNPQKYLGNVKKLIDVRYLQESMDKDNYEFVLDRSSCEELDRGVLYDKTSSEYDIVYAAWATDLLPHEILDEWVNIERENHYYFVGSVSSTGRFANAQLIQQFVDCCSEHNIGFTYVNPWQTPISDEDNRIITQKSILSPDFRNVTHKKWGYLACRLVKSISYGHLGMTNSPINARFIDDSIVCENEIPKLFEQGMKHKDNKDIILHQMSVVRNHHTYLNRINGLLKLV